MSVPFVKVGDGRLVLKLRRTGWHHFQLEGSLLEEELLPYHRQKLEFIIFIDPDDKGYHL